MRPAKQSSRNQQPLEVISDPIESAKSAGLRYVTDARPGIRRLRHGKSFRYQNADSTPLRDKETLARIQSLVIPPAWQDVWICPIPNGHLQATGRDAKGRKQSRYHPHWRQVRDETKYERMMLFGAALPAIRKRVEQDLVLHNMPRAKILATLVRLMETTFIRIGNEEYAQSNHSYGLTTMRNKHVTIEGATVHFTFQGKSGVRHSIDLQDRRLARIVQRCRDLPGYELFQYIDESSEPHSIDSSDVNDYLREIAGEHFTAKDFRTWAGTVLACEMLQQFEPFESETQAKKNVVRAIESVAERLGNTPSVCRKCYVHPAVIDSYLGGAMMKTLEDQVKKEVSREVRGLREEELALMRLLHQRLKAS